jgi:hypothetical protein
MINTNHKKFRNDICKACIKRNIIKYGRFECQCDGITVEDDVKAALREGTDEHTARMMFDPVYYFEYIYGSKVRWYQSRILYCTSRNLVGRQCRQTGKTLMFMYKIFQYIATNDDKTVLVVTPRESQIKKIWDEYIFRDWYFKNAEVKESIGKNFSQSPYYNIKLDNGSKIILMIAGPGARSQTADVIYMDEAAIIPAEELSSIMGTILARGDEATIFMTSTPKGRGNMFYDSCKLDPAFNEYHVSITEVDEIKSQIDRFKKILGATGFIQECLAEFPDASGGPFNYKGIDLAQFEYEYEDCRREPGWLYFGGVDWNGPNVGTYFYIAAFNPETYKIKLVDKQVVSSAVWNQQVAKDTFKALNRKWLCKHWMTDFGYGHGTNEELKFWSTYELPSNLPGNHPDQMVKHILEPVNFGSWLEIEDPFTKEIIKKTCKSFIVSQVSKLFEPDFDQVPIMYSKADEQLTKSLENYKLLAITDKGVEKYGFEKNSDIEDHAMDAMMLAVYGIIKHYSELFKQIFLYSVPFDGKELLSPRDEKDVDFKVPNGSSIVLLTDNSPEPIHLDSKAWKEPTEDSLAFVSRTFDNKGTARNSASLQAIMKRRNRTIISRSIDN